MSDERFVLLAEDNDDDAELTMLAFGKAMVPHPIVRVHDGVEALDRLHGRSAQAGWFGPLPVVVLLDLRMPRLGGIEVLAAIRRHERTRFLPVVVLSSSAEDGDRLAAYANHVNSFVRKPVDYDRFVEVTRSLGHYWLGLNLPPPSPRIG